MAWNARNLQLAACSLQLAASSYPPCPPRPPPSPKLTKPAGLDRPPELLALFTQQGEPGGLSAIPKEVPWTDLLSSH
jgi:hypothetical protein